MVRKLFGSQQHFCIAAHRPRTAAKMPITKPGVLYVERSRRARNALPPHTGRFGRVWHVESVTWVATRKTHFMTKTGIAQQLAEMTGMKKRACMKILTALAEVMSEELKKTGKTVLPGVGMLKTQTKPATNGGLQRVFGKDIMAKAKPAKTSVKAFAAAALKKQVV